MNCKFLSDVLSTSSNHTDDSQCKSEDKSENKVFVTWPRNRSVIWLCASRLLNLSTHPAKFWGNRPWGWGNMTFSNVMWLQNWSVEALRDFFGTYSCWVSTLLRLGSTGLMKVEIHRFLFVAWPLGWCVTWSCGWGPLILSHHPATFGVYTPCESEDIIFLFVTWSRYQSVTWLCGWGPLILSHYPA